MAKYIKNEVAYYYDSHPTEEDLMGEAPIHAELIHYLMDVLKWLFREQVCVVYENINVFQTSYALTQNQQVNQPNWRSGLLRLSFST
jgi:hypothetical protein